MKTDSHLCNVPRFFTAISLRPCIIILAILATYFIPGDVCHGVSFVPNETESVKTAGNLYEKPAENSLIAGELKEGDTVTFILSQGEWCIVKLSDDRLGWAHKSLFADKPHISEKKEADEEIPSEITPVQKRVTLKFNKGRVREEPSDFRQGIKLTLEKGDTVCVIGEKEEWYLVRLDNGTEGWAHQRLFAESDEPLVSEDASVKDMANKIKEIQVDITSEEEKIVFVLSGYHPPETFVIEEAIPKVVCDFAGLSLDSGIRRQTEVNGLPCSKDTNRCS